MWQRLFSRGRRQKARPMIEPAQPRLSRQLNASEGFTPTQPRKTRSMFTGRQSELDLIVQGLTEDRAHIVLYSERGRGKTSLANVVVETLRRSGLIVVRTQCDSGSSFDSVMRGLLGDLPATFLKTPPAEGEDAGCVSAFPKAALRPDDVIAVLPKLRTRMLICVIDEFDRMPEMSSRTMFADTIKQASDRGVRLLFMVIGVADSLEQLIGQHPSIQRNILAVPLPLMSDDNISALVETGARAAELSIPSALVAKVRAISRGMPYIAHLLGLRIAQATGQRGSRTVNELDFKRAVDRLIVETPPSVVRRYDDLTEGGTNSVMIAALDAASRGRQDSWGRISVDHQGNPGVLLGGARLDCASWLRLRDSDVLHPSAGKPGHVTYTDRALLQYALLRASAVAAPSATTAERAPPALEPATLVASPHLNSP